LAAASADAAVVPMFALELGPHTGTLQLSALAGQVLVAALKSR
jgi:hypothetical protein